MKYNYLLLVSLLLGLGTAPVFGMEQTKNKEKQAELALQEVMLRVPAEMKGEVLYHHYNNPNTQFDLSHYPLIEFLPPKLTNAILDKVEWPITGFIYKCISNIQDWNWQGRMSKLPNDLKKRVERNLKLMAGPKKTSEYKCPDSVNSLDCSGYLGINNKVLVLTKRNDTPLISVWDEKTGNYLYDLPFSQAFFPLICKDKLVIPATNKINIYSLEQEKPVLFDSIEFKNTNICRVLPVEDSLLITTNNYEIYHYNIDTKQYSLCPLPFYNIDSFSLVKNYSKQHFCYDFDENRIIHWDIKNNTVGEITIKERAEPCQVSDHHLILKFEKIILIKDLESSQEYIVPGNRFNVKYHLINNFLLVYGGAIPVIDIIDLKHNTILSLKNCHFFKSIKNRFLYVDHETKTFKIFNLNTNETKIIKTTNDKSWPTWISDGLIVFENSTCTDFYNLNGSLLCSVPVKDARWFDINSIITTNSIPPLITAANVKDRFLKHDLPATLEEAVKIIQKQAKTEK